jgi:hypothetical protein
MIFATHRLVVPSSYAALSSWTGAAKQCRPFERSNGIIK